MEATRLMMNLEAKLKRRIKKIYGNETFKATFCITNNKDYTDRFTGIAKVRLINIVSDSFIVEWNNPCRDKLEFIPRIKCEIHYEVSYQDFRLGHVASLPCWLDKEKTEIMKSTYELDCNNYNKYLDGLKRPDRLNGDNRILSLDIKGSA
jgi:hypothetical protein